MLFRRQRGTIEPLSETGIFSMRHKEAPLTKAGG